MKKLFLIAGLIVGLTGCTRPDQATKALADAGYTNVEITGYRFFSCSDSDDFSTGFKATGPSGRPVSGAVCGAFFKGQTIRLD